MNMMSFILNWFFDDYGFPSGWWWALMYIIAIIFSVAIQHVYDSLIIKRKILKIIVVFSIVYAGIFLPIMILNPYQYMAASGTAIQKLNVQRCTAAAGISVTHYDIKGIMWACEKQER